MTTIDLRSPERDWPPFVDWLEEHGIPASLCWAVDLGDGEDPRCVAHLYATNEDGERYLNAERTGPAIREPVAFIARRPAPRRSS